MKACVQWRNRYLACIVTLALNTGMRRGEILGLTWERVNLDADYGFNAKITLYRTKNGKPRSVALNQAAYATLAALEPDLERRKALVFTRQNGQPWGDVDTAFRSVLKKAGIGNFRFHDLRHTAASHLTMRGRSLKEVQEFMGHRDSRMTMRSRT